MDDEEMKKIAKDMIYTGIEAVDPEKLVKKSIQVEENMIKICGETFSREDYTEIFIIGIGKASIPMASACDILDPDDGIVITDHRGPKELAGPTKIEVKAAYHPYPKKANLEAAKALISKIKEKKNSLFILLISGGGSALFLSPAEGITVNEMNKLNRSLVKSGADIHEINTVRKHLSKVKGGHLGKELSKRGDVISLIISDVVGNDLSSVASGPTCPDPTTFEDAKKVLTRYGLWDMIPKSVKAHINKGLAKEVEDTPKYLETKNFLIGDNMMALQGASKVAYEQDFHPLIFTSQNTGEAKEVAKAYMGIAKEIQDTENPIRPPAALIFGGEMTVAFRSNRGGGRGGPNREFVLSSAIEIRDRENIVVASADTDGIDGVGKSGAVADTGSIKQSEHYPDKLLKEHDSEIFFDDIDCSLEFKSETNVNDISVILIGSSL